jgi:hypothetical protein
MSVKRCLDCLVTQSGDEIDGPSILTCANSLLHTSFYFFVAFLDRLFLDPDAYSACQ